MTIVPGRVGTSRVGMSRVDIDRAAGSSRGCRRESYRAVGIGGGRVIRVRLKIHGVVRFREMLGGVRVVDSRNCLYAEDGRVRAACYGDID